MYFGFSLAPGPICRHGEGEPDDLYCSQPPGGGQSRYSGFAVGHEMKSRMFVSRSQMSHYLTVPANRQEALPVRKVCFEPGQFIVKMHSLSNCVMKGNVFFQMSFIWFCVHDSWLVSCVLEPFLNIFPPKNVLVAARGSHVNEAYRQFKRRHLNLQYAFTQ